MVRVQGRPGAAAANAQALPVLINLSARLRMLSHRICLFLLLQESMAAGEARERHLQTLQASMDEFEKIFSSIVDGNPAQGLPRLQIAAVRDFLFGGEAPPVQDIQHFIASMRRLGGQVGRGTADVAEAVHGLADFTTGRLLGVLDRLTLAFQTEAAQQSKAQQAQVAQSLEELDVVNRTTLLISFNAKVEAMRAGQTGRSFSAIADEIQRLAKQTQEVAAHLRLTTTGPAT